MFCRFCGKEIPEGGRFCVNCGRAADEEKAPGGTSRPDTANPGGQQNDTSRPDGQQAYTPVMPPVQADPAKNYPMAWFKFIIYFQLFANAAVMLYNAASGVFGLAYGGDAEFIYAVCPMLKAVDVIYGILCLAFAVTAVLIRQRLAHYRKNAPVWYLGYVGVVMASGLIYTFAVLAALGMVSATAMEAGAANIIGTVLGTVIGAAVFFPLNYVYFKKRKELFGN